jgi:uncharacterized protein (TIGR02145 family)
MKNIVLMMMLSAVVSVCLMGCVVDDNPDNGGGNGGDVSYDYVEIGGVKWMSRNLNITTKDSWCYGNSTANCNKYGRLYTWKAAKKACQSIGWRLPSDKNWEALRTAGYDITNANTCTPFKSTSGWNENGNGTDDFGFSALPGGIRDPWDGFKSIGSRAEWWVDWADGMMGSPTIRMFSDGYIDRDGGFQDNDGRSVRCVLDY